MSTIERAADPGVIEVLGAAVGELFTGSVTRIGETTGVELGVANRWEPAPLHRLFFLTSVAITATLALTATVLTAEFRRQQHEFDVAAEQSLTAVVDGASLARQGESVEAMALGANITWFITGGFALTSIVLAFFTDWSDDTVLAPTAVGGGLGAALRVSF